MASPFPPPGVLSGLEEGGGALIISSQRLIPTVTWVTVGLSQVSLLFVLLMKNWKQGSALGVPEWLVIGQPTVQLP